jgi:hypothetical protein
MPEALPYVDLQYLKGPKHGQYFCDSYLDRQVQWDLKEACTDEERNTITENAERLRSALEQETEWVPAHSSTPGVLKDEYGRAVANDEMVCPLCNGSGYVSREFVGKNTNYHLFSGVKCACVFSKLYFTACEPMLDAHYRNVRLETLMPRESPVVSIQRQQEIIDVVKGGPFDSWLFIGPARAGKTHLAASLFREAGRRWAYNIWQGNADAFRGVWITRTNELLDHHHRFVTKETDKKPLVTTEIIAAGVRAGHAPYLGLEDLHLFRPTLWKLGVLQTLVDAVTANGGSVVATSNWSTESLKDTWEREIPGAKDIADAILGRIYMGEGRHRVIFADRDQPSAPDSERL